ncbi:MAG: DUF5320 family protein [Thermoanaerobaculales bacterium]|nr:DUF5320 family protein [Thermoanaerobaculales bacterium]
MTSFERGRCGRTGGWSFAPGWAAGRGGPGLRRGHGWRGRSWASRSPGMACGWWWGAEAPGRDPSERAADERQLLEREASSVESELARVRARLEELRDRSPA